MKKTSKSLGRIFSIVLCLSMLASMGSVFAQDVGSDGSKGEYVKVASIREDFDDGSYLIKELEVFMPNSRLGFSGFLDARASNFHYANGNIAASIVVTASFSSIPGKNECYLYHGTYSTNNTGNTLSTISNELERRYSNQVIGGSIARAEYMVDYSYSGKDGSSTKAWVRCDANGNTSNSRLIQELAPNEYAINGMIISFG